MNQLARVTDALNRKMVIPIFHLIGRYLIASGNTVNVPFNIANPTALVMLHIRQLSCVIVSFLEVDLFS